MGDVVDAFGAHTNMTVQECLEYCSRRHADYSDVLVIGYDADGCLMVRSSAMSRRDANWMIDAAKLHVWQMLGD